MQGQSFLYNHGEINDLERLLSSERLNGYLAKAGGDREAAILYYEQNTAYSEALYGVLQGLEVALRSAIHNILSMEVGPDWWHVPKIGLLHPQTEMVQKAQVQLRKLKKPNTPGRMVAELSLGFWTALLSSRYEKRLWIPHLLKVFPHATRTAVQPNGTTRIRKIDRQPIFDRLDRVRDLRNRIAHHENILGRSLKTEYEETIEAISWMCPTTARWVESTNCFVSRFRK